MIVDAFIYPMFTWNQNGPVILVSRKIEYVFPMGYAYLAGYLRERGEPVEVLFKPTGKKNRQKFVDEIVRKEPVLVAFGGLFPEMEELREWISLFPIDRRFPIVIGGQIVSPTPELAMRKINADFGVVGEGEIVLHKLVIALREGKNISDIGGLVIRTPQGFIHTGAGEIIQDLSQLPKIPFELFPEQDWLPIGQWYARMIPQVHWRYTDRVIPVHGGRGCPFFCNFCYHHSKPRYRPVPDMIAESKSALEKYKGNFLYFGDDLVIGTPTRAKQLVEELAENDIRVSYSISTRFDILKRLDNETLLNLKRSGCRIMGLGIESGSDRILKIIGKNITATDILAQLKRLKDVGILPTVSIMVGQDTETVEDVELSIKLMRESVRQDPNINYAFTITTPFPGSELYDRIFKQGLLKDEDDYYNRYFFTDKRRGDWDQVVNLSAMGDDEVGSMHRKITRVYRWEKFRALGFKTIVYDLIYLSVCKLCAKLNLSCRITPLLISMDRRRLRYHGIDVS